MPGESFLPVGNVDITVATVEAAVGVTIQPHIPCVVGVGTKRVRRFFARRTHLNYQFLHYHDSQHFLQDIHCMHLQMSQPAILAPVGIRDMAVVAAADVTRRPHVVRTDEDARARRKK